MNANEAIEMLEILIQSACNVSDTLGRSATVLDNVKIDSFTWVIKEAIRLLKLKNPNVLEQLIEAQQKVMKIMKEEPNEAVITYRGGFVEGLDLAINLVKKANEND